jgi:uncharacterized protein YndB with AHSA1/START domain
VGEVVTREVVLPATVEDVWRSLVDPDELAAWFDAEVDFDARPGGAATFRTDDGVRIGVVEEVEVGRRLAYRWWPEENRQAATTVTFTIDPVPSGTRLVVVEAFASAGPSRAVACNGAAWGRRCASLVWSTSRLAVRA